MSEPYWVPLGGGPAQAEVEAAYAEFTTPFTITPTSEATAEAMVTAPPITADGATSYLIEFFAPTIDTPDGSQSAFVLFEDSTPIGQIGTTYISGGTTQAIPYGARRVTPSAGSHVYSIRAFMIAGSGATVYVGTGAADQRAPGFIRVTRAVQQVLAGGAQKSVEEVRLLSQGLKGEAFHRSAIQAAQILTTSTAQAVAVGLRKGDIVTNLICGMSVVASGNTLIKMGLYDGASPANRLAVSADQKALFQGGSVPRGVVVPMITPYTAPDDMAAYIVLLGVGGTQPTVLRGVNLGVSSFQIGTARQSHWQAAVSDLTATLTPVQSGLGIWAGWS